MSMKELSRAKLKSFGAYDDHTKVYKVENKKAGLKGFIAIHRQRTRFPALGATRFWQYNSEDDALRDALRLSRLMSYKSALIGLPNTGAKAVIISNDVDPKKRKEVFQAYGKEVEKLGGSFITGTDAGVTLSDVKEMAKSTDYLVGFTLDPAYYTAVGVTKAIELCLSEKFGSESLRGRTFAVQGLGKSGMSLVALLHKKAKKIYVCDISEDVVKRVKKQFPKITPVDVDEIYDQKVDVFCPCALSSTINKHTVPRLKCKIVVGSANNQLSHKNIGALLRRRKILYAPDYISNSGGLISVVDEHRYGKADRKRILYRLSTIKESLTIVFNEAKKERKPVNIVANTIAEELIFNE